MSKRAKRKYRNGVRTPNKKATVRIDVDELSGVVNRAAIASAKAADVERTKMSLGGFCLLRRIFDQQAGYIKNDPMIEEARKCIASGSYEDVDGLAIIFETLATEYAYLDDDEKWIKEPAPVTVAKEMKEEEKEDAESESKLV